MSKLSEWVDRLAGFEFKKLAEIRDLFFEDSDANLEAVPGESGNLPRTLFLMTVLFYITYQCVLETNWMTQGEMFAEMATNYFFNAHSPSIFQKFFATDAGYVPAPQRLISLLGNLVFLPASWIPYYYTWSAVITTALLVGVFCLKEFRIVLKNDFLRFVLCLSVLMMADFETKTYVNFTYFSAFFSAIITAFALVSRKQEVPKWSWVLPVFMISKPAVLAALPGMVLTALVSLKRFRKITVVTLLLAGAQLIRMKLSQQGGQTPSEVSQTSIVVRVLAALKYAVGFLGSDVFSPTLTLGSSGAVFTGLVLLGLCGYALRKSKNQSRSLILVGLLLLFFNYLLNSVVSSLSWNGDLSTLSRFPMYRRVIVGVLGSMLILVGLISSLTEAQSTQKKTILTEAFPPLAWVVWFISVGWLSFGLQLSAEPGSPILYNSQWQKLAPLIDSQESIVCVPIDPFGWGIYGRNCSMLNPGWNLGQGYGRILANQGKYVLDVPVPTWVSSRTMHSMGILLKPTSSQESQIEVKAFAIAKDGTQQEYIGSAHLRDSGGMILLSQPHGIGMKNLANLKLEFNRSVDMRVIVSGSTMIPAILWMGH